MRYILTIITAIIMISCSSKPPGPVYKNLEFYDSQSTVAMKLDYNDDVIDVVDDGFIYYISINDKTYMLVLLYHEDQLYGLTFTTAPFAAYGNLYDIKTKWEDLRSIMNNKYGKSKKVDFPKEFQLLNQEPYITNTWETRDRMVTLYAQAISIGDYAVLLKIQNKKLLKDAEKVEDSDMKQQAEDF